jgi:hypothetical protein
MNREEKKLEAAMKKEAIIRFCKLYEQGREKAGGCYEEGGHNKVL